MMIDSNYLNLAVKLQETERVRRRQLFETTTMDAISFLPAQMGVVRDKVKKLSKLKQKWGLEILEDDDGNKDVRIEDVLRITVPKEHWDIFQEMFVGDLNNDSYLNLKSLLNEVMEDELKDLRDDLKPALVEMFSEQRFCSLDKTITVWQGRFGINSFVTDRNNVAVVSSQKEKGIQRLYGDLLRAYGEDRGGLEMLLNNINSNEPLGAYDVLKKYDFLYGSRVKSRFLDVNLIFEATVDMAFVISESIYVSDEAVLDEIEDNITTVKRVGSVLYPANEMFDVDFFGTLQEFIEESEESELKDEKDRAK